MDGRRAIAIPLLTALAAGCGGGAEGQFIASSAPPAQSSTNAVAAPDTAVAVATAPGTPPLTAATPPAASPPETGPPPQTPPPASGGTTSLDLQAVVQLALADAARGTGLDIAALAVVSAEAVTWPDGSLGCPQPGMAYTMALVPGYRVRIRAGETMLDYHAGGRQLILCPSGLAVDPLPVQSS